MALVMQIQVWRQMRLAAEQDMESSVFVMFWGMYHPHPQHSNKIHLIFTISFYPKPFHSCLHGGAPTTTT